jgi:hypothetical protein
MAGGRGAEDRAGEQRDAEEEEDGRGSEGSL